MLFAPGLRYLGITVEKQILAQRGHGFRIPKCPLMAQSGHREPFPSSAFTRYDSLATGPQPETKREVDY